MEARDRCQSRIVRAIEQSSFFFLSYISKGESRRSGGHVEREVRATRCAQSSALPSRMAPFTLRLREICGELGEMLCTVNEMECEILHSLCISSVVYGKLLST